MIATTVKTGKYRPNTSFKFLNLPLELRTLVLEYLLVYSPEHDIQITHSLNGHADENNSSGASSKKYGNSHRLIPHATLSPLPESSQNIHAQTAVLFTCRFLYTEALPILYSKNTFVFRSLSHLHTTFLTQCPSSTTLLLRSIRFYNPDYLRGSFYDMKPLQADFCNFNKASMDGLHQPNTRQWWGLRHVQNIDFIFSWNEANQGLILIPSGAAILGKGWDPATIPNHRTQFSTVCERLESEMWTLVKILTWVSRTDLHDATWPTKYDEFRVDLEVKMQYHITSGLGIEGDDGWAKRAEDILIHKIKVALRGHNTAIPPAFPDLVDTVNHMLTQYWKQVIVNGEKKGKSTKEVYLRDSLASRLATKSLSFVKDRKTWGDLFVIRLVPTWMP